MNSAKNILITGLPRAGTNLTCRLLNQVEDVIAIQEAMDVAAFGRLGSTSKIYERIDEFILEVRTAALEQGLMWNQHVRGKVEDDYFQPPDETTTVRKKLSETGYIKLNRKVTSNMVVVIKHNAAFAGLLPDLQSHYPVYAMVRNPLWALASWNSNDIPPYHGRLPMGEQLDPRFTKELDEIPDRIDRQIHVVSWLFSRISTLDPTHVLRYEDMVESRGKCLKAVVPGAEKLDEPLSDENRAGRYPFAPLKEIKQRLLDRGGPYFDFYPRQLLLDEQIN